MLWCNEARRIKAAMKNTWENTYCDNDMSSMTHVYKPNIE